MTQQPRDYYAHCFPLTVPPGNSIRLGVFYPDGTPTQRVGIKVDLQVRPTIQGLREQRDELLEKAMEFLAGQ